MKTETTDNTKPAEAPLMVHGVPVDLRRAFHARALSNGLTIRAAILALMREYVEPSGGA